MEKKYPHLKKAILCCFGLGLFVAPGIKAQGTQTLTYSFTGATQTFVVPSCVSTITVEARGAQGASQSPGGTGGLGGSAIGIISVSTGQVLYLNVGGQNGFNGGGNGGINGNSVFNGVAGALAGNGGGATDIRVGGAALTNRIFVAGGGGGAAHEGVWTACQVAGPAGNGGAGGGLTGGAGSTGSSFACNCAGGGGNGGGGATGTAGGAAGTYNGINATTCLQTWGIGNPGALGAGGNGSSVYYNGTGGGGGGGGGYYGGGSGGSGSDTTPGGGGGGGSSYTGAATNTVVASGVQSGDGQLILTFDYNGSGVLAAAVANPICSGSSVNLIASNVVTYTWSTGSNNTSISVSPTVNTTYTVQGTNALGCISYAILTMTVDQGLPTLTVAATPTTLCAGRTATLTANGATTYTWTNGATTIPNATSFVPAATTAYTVTGGNGCGTTTAVASITVNPLPNVGGSVNNPTVCNGSQVIFNGTGSANGYTWTNGVTNNTAYTPAATNVYTVTGVSAQGCTNTAVVGVTVYITPNTPPVITPTAICLGKTATLSATGATGYTWTAPPSAAFSNANTVTVSPSGTTTYTLNRTNGACSSTATISLQINALPTIILGTPNPSVVCANNAASLSAVGAITYTWYPGGLQGSNVTVYPNYSSSLVNYTVVASNANCTISAVSSLSTNPNPTITINPSSTVVCAGSPATLTANGASTYTWQSPVNLAQQTVTVNPLIPTLYNVTGTNIYGCTAQQSQVLLVNAAPNLTASIANPGGYICAGGIGTLVANGSGPTNYSWSNGSTAPSITVNPTSTTAYTVTGINPTTLCQSTSTVSLAVYISTFVIASPTAICKGQTATLTASGGATSYTWTTNAAASSITVSPLNSTTYYVTGTTGNCSTTQSVGLTVNPIPPVTASAFKGTICRFEPGQLTASGATSYLWSTGATTGSITVTPTVTTTYTVTGTDANGCSKTVNVTQFINACLGIAEVNNNLGELLSIYPNPNNGDFTIQAETAVNIKVVSETGQLIKQASLTSTNKQVNISSLANGIYFIVVEKDGNTATKKVVVSK